MHSRDVTEILKVFEKRLTKLEVRVAELESAKEEPAPKQSEQAVENLGTGIADISVTSMSTESWDKVSYSKNEILSWKSSSGAADELNDSHVDVPPTISEEPERMTGEPYDLEEGEIYEPPTASVPFSPKSRVVQKKLSKSADEAEPRSSKTLNRQRARSTVAKGGGDVAKQQKVGRRDRAKSDMTDPIPPFSKSRDIPEPPAGKQEIRYGLMVQFPPEG